MELRLASARATKDIDLTCLLRADGHDAAIEKVITEKLRELAKEDLDDYFTFEIGEARMDLDNTPYGGARYSVASFLDKRLFVRFQLDIGADIIVDEIELRFLAVYSLLALMVSDKTIQNIFETLYLVGGFKRGQGRSGIAGRGARDRSLFV